MMSKNSLKRILALVLIVSIMITAFVWLYSHAYADFSLPNKQNGTVNYAIYSSKIGTTPQKGSSTDTHFKKLLSRGSHQVEFSQNNTSYVASIHVGGFLGKTAVTVQLAPEKARQFVGDNPGPCVQYVAGILLSNTCGGNYSTTKMHVPATNNTATYTKTDPNPLIGGTNEGFTSTTDGSYVLVAQYSQDENVTLHSLFKQGLVNGVITNTYQRALPGLGETTKYTLASYKNGLIAYDNSLSNIYFYPTMTSSATYIGPGKLNDKTLSGGSLTTAGNVITLLYSNLNDANKVGPKNLRSEIVTVDNSTNRHFSFKKAYISAYGCGQKLVCALSGTQLDVYDISNKPKLVYSLSDVQAITSSDSGLAIVTAKGLLAFDVTKRTGAYLYSFAGYTFNAVQPVGNNYILSITGPTNKRYALYIDTSGGTNDNMDKKYYSLLQVPEVESASLYKNILYISPQMGELVYDTTTHFFGYDPVIKAASNKKIDEAIKAIGIDSTAYKIINTTL